MAENEEIVLSEPSDEDLVKQKHDDLYDGPADEIVEGTNLLLSRRWAADRVLNDALVEGMRIVASTSATGSCSSPRCCSRRTDQEIREWIERKKATFLDSHVKATRSRSADACGAEAGGSARSETRGCVLAR